MESAEGSSNPASTSDADDARTSPPHPAARTKSAGNVYARMAVACAEIVPNAYRLVERRIECAREMKKGSTDPEVTHVVPLRGSECDDVDFCGVRSFLVIVAR
jgi:hypothetical protein